MTLSQDQVDRYFEDGFITVPDAVSPALLAEIRRVTEEIVAGAANLTASDEKLDLEDSHTPEAPRVRRIKSPHANFPFFRELAAAPALLDVVAPLLGRSTGTRNPGIRIHNTKLNMKSAGYGAPVEWHQDWAFYPHTNDDVLAVGILLDDCDAENGPMLMIPGSHKGPVYDHHAQGRFCGAIDPKRNRIDFDKAVALTGPAGTMTVHHARTIHGSAQNRSARPRRLLLYAYAAADAWPLLGLRPGQSFEQFNDLVVAGAPTREPRMAEVPVRLPLPPAVNQGSIYENHRTLENKFFEGHDAGSRAAE